MKLIKKLFSDKDEKNLIINILMAFAIKGASLLLSLFSMPLYIKYFNNDAVLGIWYTILSLISWINICDLGLGNGLRNRLTEVLSLGDFDKAKKYISSTYVALTIIILPVFLIISGLICFANLNSFFNISADIINKKTLLATLLILFFGIAIHFILKVVSNVIYAIQKSFINNLIALCTSILPLFYIGIFNGQETESNLIHLSIVHVVAINLPLLIATVVVFRSKLLKECTPTIKSFDWKTAKGMLGFGLQFFLAQSFFMFLISTNEIFITKIFSPDDVVEYSIYYRLFTAIGSLFMLALTPMWSKVTKDLTERKYNKIKTTNKVLYAISSVAMIVQLLMLPFLQGIINLWLQKEAIKVDSLVAVAFAIYGGLYIFNVVLTTVANGMGDLKSQIVFYGIGAILKIPAILVLKMLFDSWVVVIIFNAIILLVFCCYQLLWVERKINILIKAKEQ